MDIRMICIDLDGTALQNDHMTISPRLIAALEKAHAQGIAVVPVTGRPFGLLPPALAAHPEWLDLAVLCNGAQVRKISTGELLYHLDLPRHALEQILELSRDYDLPVEFCVDSKLHLTRHSLELQQPHPRLAFHLNTILPMCGEIVDSLEPFCAKNVEKVNLLCLPDAHKKEIVRRLDAMDISAVFASSSSMEITHRDASKGNSLRLLCGLLDIPMECVMALGDSGNDETMLRQAGLGVAMGNAPDFVRSAADAVTETNSNDGAAIAIERYALNL